jgi:hypothetical protein
MIRLEPSGGAPVGALGASHMTDSSARSSAFLDQLRRRRHALHEHIRQSEINIACSKEVLAQVDKVIAAAEKEE